MGKPEKDPGDQKMTLSLTPLGSIAGIAELYRRGKVDVGTMSIHIREEFVKAQVDALRWTLRATGGEREVRVKIRALQAGFEVIPGD